MQHTLIRWGAAILTVTALAGCGGGGSTAVAPAPTGSVASSITNASALAINDTSFTDPAANPSTPFLVVQDAGVAAVTINSPPKVNFAVFSDGKVKTDLVISNVRFAIAKLVPGTDGDPDQWVNYISSTKTATAGVGPGGTSTPRATAVQATTDSQLSLEELEAANLAGQLVFNPDGYYTYTFKTDITDPTKTNGVVYEPSRTHRVAIQLSYKNAAGETVLVNPYFDFTLVDGKSVAVTDPAKTRKMADVTSCNSCHGKLALHGGGRVDTQFCVMCHNPGTVDPESGNTLTLATMVHSIHAGKRIKAATGEDYTIWGYKNSKHDYAEVGFPQDLRNCTKCHSGDNPKTPQGDNWKTMPSKAACLTCHASQSGSAWYTSHTVFATDTSTSFFISPTAKATDLPNSACANCHKAGSNISSERVHWNQNEENAAKYKMNIESTTYDAGTRKVTVKYFLSDPTNGDTAYNLVTSDCASTTVPTCGNQTKFGNLSFRLAYQNLVGQSTAVTEFSAYNNGGSSASAFAYKGVNDGSNHYTVDISIPADTATAVAAGTARVVSIGQIKEPKLEAKAATDPRPEVSPRVLVNTVVQHTFKELALTGTLNPRRAIVSNEKCNACHGALGTTSGANTLAEAFHSGARNTVEACVVCHDANRASSTVMTNGLVFNESFQFKRMIHGIHGNSKRTYPFTHGNKVLGAFGKDGLLLSDGVTPMTAGTVNYAAEVAWPGVGINCNVCHVNNSYKQDLGPLGAVILKGPTTLVGSGFTVAADADPLNWLVISPKAASCTACHDSSTAMGHVASFGGAAFGNKTQAGIAALPRETCDDCHASGGFKGVDLVHGQN